MHLSSVFLFYGVPQRTVDAHPHGRWCIFFTQSIHSNANLFASGNTLRDTPGNNGFSAIRTSLKQSSRHTKLTITIGSGSPTRRLQDVPCWATPKVSYTFVHQLLEHLGYYKCPQREQNSWLLCLEVVHSHIHSLTHSQTIIDSLSYIKDVLDTGAQRLLRQGSCLEPQGYYGTEV